MINDDYFFVTFYRTKNQGYRRIGFRFWSRQATVAAARRTSRRKFMPLAVDTDAIKSYVPHGTTERAFAIYPNSDTVNAKVPCSARVAVAQFPPLIYMVVHRI